MQFPVQSSSPAAETNDSNVRHNFRPVTALALPCNLLLSQSTGPALPCLALRLRPDRRRSNSFSALFPSSSLLALACSQLLGTVVTLLLLLNKDKARARPEPELETSKSPFCQLVRSLVPLLLFLPFLHLSHQKKPFVSFFPYSSFFWNTTASTRHFVIKQTNPQAVVDTTLQLDVNPTSKSTYISEPNPNRRFDLGLAIAATFVI